MKNETINRREAVRRFFLASAAVAVPGWMTLGCSKGEPSCLVTTGLSAEDLQSRTQVVAYAEKSPDPTKECTKCQQYVPGPEGECGTCKVVKGPINPKGTCKSFVVKPA